MNSGIKQLANQEDRSSMVNAFFDYPLQKDKFIAYKKEKGSKNSSISLLYPFIKNRDQKLKFLNALNEFSFKGLLDDWNANIRKNKYKIEAINNFKLDSFFFNILVLKGFFP